MKAVQFEIPLWRWLGFFRVNFKVKLCMFTNFKTKTVLFTCLLIHPYLSTPFNNLFAYQENSWCHLCQHLVDRLIREFHCYQRYLDLEGYRWHLKYHQYHPFYMGCTLDRNNVKERHLWTKNRHLFFSWMRDMWHIICLISYV